MKFTKTQWIAIAVGGIVLLVLGYIGGSAYAGSHPASGSFAAGAGRTGAYGAGGAGFAGRGGAGAGTGAAGAGSAPTIGTVLSQGNGTLTVATQGGGSRIVLVSASTTVMTESTSSVSALQTGETVTILGTTNSDGSVSAKSIQARQ